MLGTQRWSRGSARNLWLGLWLPLVACGSDPPLEKEQLPPTISSIAPTSGPVGTLVTIEGTEFSDKGWNLIRFNGVDAKATSWTTTELVVAVPDKATSGPVTVDNGYGTATAPEPFTVEGSTDRPPTGPPKILGFSPIHGPAGTVVTIRGEAFAPAPGDNTVMFGGVLAAVSEASNTELVATVPPTAMTGPISVRTLAGTFDTAEEFIVTQPPPAPEVTAVPVSESQVNVSWTLVSAATGYNIYRATVPGVAVIDANRITAAPVARPPHADTGLTPGTTYYYVVTAVSASGESLASNEVSAMPTTPPPEKPIITSFSPTSGAMGASVVITGSHFNAQATNNTVTFFDKVPASVVTATTTALTVTVPPGAATGPISVTTASGTAVSPTDFVVLVPPPAPTGVTGTAISATEVSLSWTLVTGATGYNIYRATVPGAAKTAANRITAAPVAGPPYTDAGLTTGTTYYYVVTAVSDNGESAASAEVAAVPSPPPPKPPVINDFTPTSGKVGTLVTITGAYFSAMPTNNTVTFGGAVPAYVNSATTSELVATVPAGATTGKIKVTTATGSIESATSFTVLQPPAAPTGVAATPVNATQINIGWNLVTGATSYSVYRSTTAGVAAIASNRIAASVSAPPHNDTNLTTGTTYYYVVTASNANGESAASNEVSAVPPSSLAAPGNVTAVAGVGQVTVDWNAVTGATSYNIYYATGTTIPTRTTGIKIAGATRPYVHSNLTTGLTHNYVVTAVNATEESAESTAVSATPAVPLIVGRLVSGIPQTILQSNIEVSVKDNLGAAISNASVSLNNVSLAYDATAKTYKGFVAVSPGEAVALNVTINNTSYSLPGSTYYYAVTALNAHGESGRSSTAAAMPVIPLTDAPTISNVSGVIPTSGPVAATVSLSGTHFSAVPVNNSVTFGGVPAEVIAATDTSLTVKVPSGTAITVPLAVEVTTSAGTVTAAEEFTVTVAPAAPKGFYAVQASADPSVDLTWKAVDGATGYRVYRATSANVALTDGNRIATVLAPATSHPDEDEDLTAGTAYYYVVTAYNDHGQSPASAELSLTPVATLPDPPTLPTAAFSPTSGVVGTTVTITGTNFSTVRGNNTVLFANDVPAVVSSATATSLSVQVPAGAATGAITVKTPGHSVTSSGQFTVTMPPVAPTGLTAVPLLATQVRLSWDSMPGATGYHVYRGTSPSALSRITVAPISASTFDDTGLTRAVTQFTDYPAITNPPNNEIWSSGTSGSPLPVSWDAGAPFPASYNYGLIIFDTLSLNPYWANALYWNNYIAGSAANPPEGSGAGTSVPKGIIPASKNLALFVYMNTTETITLGGAVGGTSVGSIDIIGASDGVTIITQ